MSHFFGLGNGRVTRVTAARIERIARQHGATFEALKMPEGHRYWFACPNRGAPFDGETAGAVVRALEAAGLWPVPTAPK